MVWQSLFLTGTMVAAKLLSGMMQNNPTLALRKRRSDAESVGMGDR
jgi:hypothetical protein